MRIVLLTIFTLSCFLAVSQYHFPPTVNYSSQDYGREENPETYSVAQDKRGVMYFGTGNNVLEYDGKAWNSIQVQQGSYIWSLGLDSNGVVYAGGTGEFGFLKPNEIGELEYQSLIPKLPEEEQMLVYGNVWQIHANDSNVYFQTEAAIYEYNYRTDELTTIVPSTTYHTCFMLEGDLYIREREVGLVKYENGQTTLLEGTEQPFEIYGLFGLHRVPDDSLLLITQELGIYKWKDGGMRQLPELNDIPLASLGIYGSLVLADGNIGLRTSTMGMVVINWEGKIIRRFDRNAGVRSNDVKEIFQDRDLNVWLALGNGIAKINYNSPMSYYDAKTGIDGNVESIVRYKGNLFVGTSFGLFKQNNDVGSNKLFLNTGAIRGQVWDFKIIDDVLYAACGKGVLKTSDGENFSSVLEMEGTNVVEYLPSKDVIVVAGKNGIYTYNRDFQPIWQYPDRFSGVLGSEVDPVHKNTVWIGTSTKGVFRIKAVEDDYILDNYTEMEGLNDDNLGKPIVIDQKLIFGTSQGVLSFITEEEMYQEVHDSLKDDPDNYRGMFQSETFHDTIFDAPVLLLAGSDNRTWYCHNNELGYYDRHVDEFVYKPFWGVQHGRFNEFYLEENGVLWIGSSDGLIRYESNPLKRYDTEFRALIRRVVIGRDSLLYSGSMVDDNGWPTLVQEEDHIFKIPFEHNNIKFNFSAPYFEDDHPILYSYKLVGQDDEWSPWLEKSEANFTNLSEGDYVFQLKAKNIYHYQSLIAEYKFSVLPPWYRTTWAYIMYGLLFILVLYLGVRISSARLKAKNAWLEGVVAERTKEIQQKNVVLRHQKEEIEDSINYAQRIQEAILPLQDEMDKWIPHSFVLFRPKDIVSGDFYWFQEKNRKLVFVCADCTGHGVPGAFMSMLGSNGLNNIVMERNITSPGEIFANLNRTIKKNLKQDGQKGSTRDGMDAAICTLDLDKKTLTYSGANRPLWIVENGDLQEIKATKVAVAGFTPDDQVFEEHQIELNGSRKFYMTSDGYADQFGGEREKKYKVKNMKNFILEHCDKPFNQQRELLEKELFEWMGDIEQIDDVCVIGFQA